ncbi:Glyoxylate/hydroxypyruvate reductase B [Planococcus massiliensis]|uniref:Glyoxylate/hydroxypyruvate reductase B n=1 Tax=Planococcus massiliensis TaxID=1499687 RepID=A0A098EJG1_9BACL|nr:D-glycerate dehydrogenase [Planococcus massiliensis]CEG21446.1 Glyoxylate/hydroxypyruvate reductase B [Planococcus massiliensis]
MKPKVFIARPVPPEVEAYIAKHCDYKIWKNPEKIPNHILLEEAKKVDGMLVQNAAVTRDFLSQLPNLKVISNTAVGYDSFDLDAMKEFGVIGTHTPFVLDETVADLVFALILSAARRVPELNNYVKQGQWNKDTKAEELFGTDVHHATLGIVGMGRIGEKIARRAVFGFEMNVLYHATTPKPDLDEKYGMRYSGLDELLSKSDFVVLIVPLTDSTRHMLSRDQFRRMKSSAYLINAARGAVVDESALIEALKSGEIAGAALDVFEKEPVDLDNPLLKMKQVTALPHIGSATAKTREAMVMKAAENLVAGVTGEVPENVMKELKT